MDEISIDDFAKIDIRVGKVIEATAVPESSKLIKLQVDFGKLGERTIFAGIKAWYKPEDLTDKNFIFLYNLKPKAMMGEESQGMMLAAEDEDEKECVLLIPDKDIPAGTQVH
ncbi:MAG: methionine--tRNA ligase subunit beta [Patescibacteria group bacterium]